MYKSSSHVRASGSQRCFSEQQQHLHQEHLRNARSQVLSQNYQVRTSGHNFTSLRVILTSTDVRTAGLGVLSS